MKPLTFALVGCACLSAGAAGAAEFEPRLRFSAPAGERVVALTLDACGGGFDRRIFDALVDSQAKATIFVTDRWIRKNPQALAELKAHASQFQIENHGLNHVPAATDRATIFGVRTAGTIEAVRHEVEGGAKAVMTATGARPAWFRGATARYTPDALKAIADMGYKVAGFSLNADMGASLIPSLVARRLSGAKSGDVVIAHINKPEHASGAGVARAIMALAAEGVRFVRLDEVDAKTDLGPSLAAGHEVERQLHVQRDDHRRDQHGEARHPERGDELAHLRPAGGEPDQRDHREGQLKAQDHLAQH